MDLSGVNTTLGFVSKAISKIASGIGWLTSKITIRGIFMILIIYAIFFCYYKANKEIEKNRRLLANR